MRFGYVSLPDNQNAAMRLNLATQSKNYERFTNDLNRALEVLLNKTQAKQNDTLRGAFTRILEIVAFRYSSIAQEELHTSRGQIMLKSIEAEIDRVFTYTAQRLLAFHVKLAKEAYTLSLAGNSEALAQAMGKKIQYKAQSQDALKSASQNIRGENPLNRITYALNNLKRDIMKALELSTIQGLNVQEALAKVLKALPTKRIVKRPKKVLKTWQAREAAQKPKEEFGIGFINDSDWQEILDDYKEEFIPQTRSPEKVFDLPDPMGGEELEEVYGWQVEHELTDSFVKSVREGAIEAANQQGISDFVWIAVLDSKTCENCCQWRSGLTSEEIEAKLKRERKGDDCQVIVPPAHENCRCDIAPILKDAPEPEVYDAKDFEDWLNS
jgi:hypothetical protein